jgi:hypothetical protein
MADKEKNPKKEDKPEAKSSKSGKKEPTKKAPKSSPSPKKESKPKISKDTLKKILSSKDSLSPEGKIKLIKLLKCIKEKKVDVTASSGFIEEADGVGERNPIAKIEKTQGDLDNYAGQKQRIEFTDKELQSIIGFKERAQPVQQDKFLVKYETTNGLGDNLTTLVQKEREGQVFNFVAYSKKESSNNQGIPGGEGDKGPSDDDKKDDGGMPDFDSLKEGEDPGQEITAADEIVITKSITFSDDNQSPDILADFLRKLEI